jgi:hypothetical protein
VALNQNISRVRSWPASPALGGSLPASPTLEDLGNPAWIDAYHRAGGHVRAHQSLRDAQMINGEASEATQGAVMPAPNALRQLRETIRRVSGVLGQGVRDDIAKFEGIVGTNPSSYSVISQPPATEVTPTSHRQTDVVIADLQAKTSAWLDIFCPKVNQCMKGAHDAIAREDEESLAQGALSLRRALISLADQVEPPSDESRRDHTGKERPVGREQFKNRLYIYLGRRLASGQHRALALTELELIERRLSPFVRAVSRGLHADGSKDDLAQLYTTTWSVVAQVVRCAESAPSTSSR